MASTLCVRPEAEDGQPVPEFPPERDIHVVLVGVVEAVPLEDGVCSEPGPYLCSYRSGPSRICLEPGPDLEFPPGRDGRR